MSTIETFYNEHATDHPFIDHRQSIVIRLVEEVSPTSVLDIGCGRGTLLNALRARNPNRRYIGADLSRSLLGEVRNAGFETVYGDITEGLEVVEDASVDCVVFGEIIEHLVDPDAAIQHIARVLRKGGHLIVTTPNIASWLNRILLLIGIQPLYTETSLHVKLGRRLRQLGQWNATEGHLKIFTLAALLEMLSANGFTPLKTKGARFSALTPPIQYLDDIFCAVPQLASDLVVLARHERTLKSSYPDA